MSVSSSSTAVMSLHKAAEDYENKVIECLSPVLRHTFERMWTECMQQAKQTNRISRRLAIFQQLLTKIPNWSTIMIEETMRHIKTDDVETLVQGLVMIKTKIQSVLSSPDAKILMKVPTLQYVVHKCLIETARFLYSNVDVMDTLVYSQKQLSNRRKMNAMIEQGIQKAVSGFVPTVALLKKQSKQIEERLRQEICVEEKEIVETKSIEMRSLATAALGNETQPDIREAPPMSTVNVPESVADTPVKDDTFMEKIKEIPMSSPETEQMEKEKDPLEIEINNASPREEEPLKPKHTIAIPTKKPEENGEMPIMVADMEKFDEESLHISFVTKPVAEAEKTETDTPSENNKEVFE